MSMCGSCPLYWDEDNEDENFGISCEGGMDRETCVYNLLELINELRNQTKHDFSISGVNEEESDEVIKKAVDLYVREEDNQIRGEIDELNDYIRCSQKNFNKLPTEQTLKDFLENYKE